MIKSFIRKVIKIQSIAPTFKKNDIIYYNNTIQLNQLRCSYYSTRKASIDFKNIKDNMMIPTRPLREESLIPLLDKFNEVLEVIAMVPWLDGELNDIKEYYMNKGGIKEIEENGFPGLTEKVHLIWKGERNQDVLINGLRMESRLLVIRILNFVNKLESEVRKE